VRLVLLAAALVGLLGPPVPSPAAAASSACLGAPADEPNAGRYPEPRVYLEAQSWWRRTPAENGTDQGHGHFGACVPAGQTVSGTLEFHWLVQLHDNPGYVKRLFHEVATDSCSDCGAVLALYNRDPAQYACAVADCRYWIRTTFDTSKSDKDGYQQVQSRLEIKEPDGNTMRPALRFMANLQHGKSEDDYNRADTNGYGWYTNRHYAYARFHSVIPRLVRGKWTVRLSFEPTSDGISRNVTRYLISVDPAFHALTPSEGMILYEADTGCPPKVNGTCGVSRRDFVIDTTKLSNGTHRLFLRADAPDASGSTNSGVLVVPFIVANELP
jgi:hypothetical protein